MPQNALNVPFFLGNVLSIHYSALTMHLATSQINTTERGTLKENASDMMMR
jgi:hypothetical protein